METPNTALQTKATLTPHPGCRGDQCPYWRAGKFPTCTKIKPSGFLKFCIWAIRKYQFRSIVLFTNTQTDWHSLCVCVCYCGRCVPFVFSPLRLKALPFLESPDVYFCRGHLWCKLSLYGDLPKTAASAWTVFKTRSRENLNIFNCLLPGGQNLLKGFGGEIIDWIFQTFLSRKELILIHSS